MKTYPASPKGETFDKQRSDLPHGRVLVVDDMMSNLFVLKKMIEKHDIHVDCASNGWQAIEIIASEEPRYDALFVDYMMPGMDGIETARKIREEIGTEYARNIPIIAFSASDSQRVRELFLNKGFQAVLPKPVNYTALDFIVRKWVHGMDMDIGAEKDVREVSLHWAADNGVADNGVDGNGVVGNGIAGNGTASNGIAGNGRCLQCGADKRCRPDCAFERDEFGRTCNRVSLFADVKIDGLDIQRGLELFGNNEETYVRLLRSYSLFTRRLVSKLAGFLATGNLTDYTITVHGVKGSCHSIFAYDVGALAERLEISSKAGKLNSVKLDHMVFEAKAMELFDNIDLVLTKIDATMKKPVAASPDPHLLNSLRDACRSNDIDRIENTMARLDMFNYLRGGEIVDWLREQVGEMSLEVIVNGDWF